MAVFSISSKQLESKTADQAMALLLDRYTKENEGEEEGEEEGEKKGNKEKKKPTHI